MEFKCENCQKPFSLGITSKGGTFTFKGGINAECPHCGHINKTPGGKVEFDTNGNVIKAFLLNNDIPEDDLLKFLSLAKVYIDDANTDQSSFTTAVAEINPQLSGLFSLFQVKTPADFFNLLTLLVTIISSVLNYNSTPQQTIINNNTTINVNYSDDYESRLRQARLDSISRNNSQKEKSSPKKSK